MTAVALTGQLICRNADEAKLVTKYLPRHIELTGAEPGCLAFLVERIGESLVWHVSERFLDEESFRAHQERIAASEWGRMTATIERRYVTSDGA